MGIFYSEQNDTFNGAAITFAIIFTVIGITALLMLIIPTYNVWSKEQNGKATLAEATFSKQVQLEQAKANLEAQKLNSLAEVERAKGAAQAIEIESGKLTENYIRYLWVQQQENLNDKTVIYIPTEAGLPITESSRVSK